MSKSYIDFFETFKGEFVASHKFKSKFARLWGKTTVDGVEVLNQKFVVYPGLDSNNVKKLLKLLGASKSFDGQSFDGVDSYYFFLNATKSTALSAATILDSLTAKINQYIGIGNSATTTLTFTDTTGVIDFTGYTKQQIIDYVTTDYNTAFDMLHSAVGEYLVESAIGEYLLFDAGQHLTYEVLNAGVSSVPYYVEDFFTTVNNDIRFRSSITIQIKFTQVSYIDKNSNIVTGILAKRKQESDIKLQGLIESDANEVSDIQWIGKLATGKTDDIWYKGRVRVSFLDDIGIKTKDKCKLLLGSIDTGYAQKEVAWWKEIIGPVLIILAIVLAVPTGGLSLETLPAFLAALAINVGIATLVMVGLQVYWSKHGDPGAAQYMGRWVKVGSIISTVAGIGAMIQVGTQAMAREAAKQAMIDAGATEAEAVIAVQGMDAAGVASFNAVNGVEVGVGTVYNAAKEMFFSSVTGSWQAMVSTGMKVAKFAMDMISKFRIEANQSEINSLTEERDKAAKELEDINDKELHIGLENIRMYSNPLTIDNVRFQVDYLYEGTKMNIGRPSFHTAKGLNVISNDIYDTTKI